MENPGVSLRKFEYAGWVLLLILCGAGLIFTSPFMTTSILIGGAIANISFGWLKRDLLKLFSGGLDGIKARFFVRYYVRLTLLVVLLFLLVKNQAVHIVGLVVGLSTVMLGILITLTLERKNIHFNNMKEAS